MDEYFAVLKQYAHFSGRAGRKEYWRFSLVQIGIAFCAGDVAGGGVAQRTGRQLPLARFGRGGAAVLCDDALRAGNHCAHLRRYRAPFARCRLLGLVAFVPYAGEAVLFALLCLKGTAGDNRFGAEPDDYMD